MPRLAFVCTGNTCRSPMACGLFLALLNEKYPETADQFAVQSAGLFALDGEPASSHAVTVLSELGIDIRNHRAARVDESVIAAADIIVALTAAHKNRIVSFYPQARDRVVTLYELAGLPEADVEDPIGSDLAEYRHTRDQIRGLIERVLLRLHPDE